MPATFRYMCTPENPEGEFVRWDWRGRNTQDWERPEEIYVLDATKGNDGIWTVENPE